MAIFAQTRFQPFLLFAMSEATMKSIAEMADNDHVMTLQRAGPLKFGDFRCLINQFVNARNQASNNDNFWKKLPTNLDTDLSNQVMRAMNELLMQRNNLSKGKGKKIFCMPLTWQTRVSKIFGGPLNPCHKCERLVRNR